MTKASALTAILGYPSAVGTNGSRWVFHPLAYCTFGRLLFCVIAAEGNACVAASANGDIDKMPPDCVVFGQVADTQMD